MNTRDAFHIEQDDLIQYALGGLKETQLGTMTAHISLCNVCRDELAKIHLDLAAYATVQPLADLPAGARERFLGRLNSSNASESRFVQMRNKSQLYRMTKSFQTWLETPMPLKILSGALAAALALMVYDDLDHIHQIRQLMPEMKRLEDQTVQLAELKDFLRGAHAQSVSLRENPLAGKAPEGHALYAATTGRLVFTASNLPSPPAGKAYELWLLPANGSAPIPAGVFRPDLLGNAAVIFPELPKNVLAGGFGVTVEEAGGATKPTPPIMLSGQ